MTENSRLTRPVLEHTIEHFMLQHAAVREAQSGLLDSILRNNCDTAFGIEHGFGQIRDVRDYQRQVPIRQWNGFSPYVDQIVQGEPDILTKEPPFLYHWTTGTTGDPKMIPFTRSCDAAAKLTHRIWVYKTLLDNPGLLDGRVLALVNAGIDGYTPSRVPYGSVSGNMYFRMPQILRQAFSNTYDVYHIEDIESRHYTLLRFAMAQNCSFLMTGNPSGLQHLFDLANRHSETLIRDIHDGGLAARFDVPKHVRAATINDLPPNPERARALSKATQTTGRLQPTDYWPDLQVIGCWLGGSMGHFAPSLREWCGDDFRFRDIGYMASEGFFSIPLGNDTPDGLLTLHSAFFEFVPEAEFGDPGAPALLAHELEPDHNYHVVLTTTGGLYRYAINDVIRVTAMNAGSPSIRFLYKGGNVQNIQGEMVSIDHVMAAMSKVTRDHNVNLRHFQVLADLANRRYVVHVEPTQHLSRSALRTLLAGFERELGKQNVNYEYFRAHGVLDAPRLRLMPTGWFARILEDHMARGRRESQFKPFVLVSSAQHGDMAEFEIAFEEATADA